MYRNVGFYADRLSLTPKYLSRIIKEASGRSAPEWIDDYVILEAKNLLKYSGLAIKEIVYKLNFPSQSVFYKFFKARTGMTPTEYKNA
jgi:AraC-like DNA-binding protein